MRQFTKDEIKMEEKAEEIQVSAKWDVGDIILSKVWFVIDLKNDPLFITARDSSKVYRADGFAFDVNEAKNVFIWLPLEHQLQDMCIPEDERMVGNRYKVLLHDFSDWVLDDGPAAGELDWARNWIIGGEAPTMLEFWIAYTMKELYQKVWNGEDWVKED